MKKRLLFIAIIVTLLVTMGVSCKSTPKADGDIEAARKKAMDFDAPAYFPSEWETVEKEPTAAAYEELFEKAVPLYAQAREDEIMAVRDEIKASGLADDNPEYLRAIDVMALQAKEQYEAKDYYAAKDTAAKAFSHYNILLVGARAYQARREVIDRGFIDYDKENFEKADESLARAKANYDKGDLRAFEDAASEALLRYNLVLANGWSQYAGTRREQAAKERELALGEKANIASRNNFREADAMFTQAEDFFSKENFRNAGLLYIDAEARFSVARKDTEEKRLLAEEAIKLAEQKVEQSSEVAVEAERLIEGGSR